MKLIDPQPMETLPEDRMDHVYVRYRTGEVLHAPRTVLWVREVGVKEFTAWSYTATPKEAAMKVEQMTNEELARFVLQAKYGDARYVIPPKPAHYSMTFAVATSVVVETATFVELAHELARRITTMIPKPVVSVVERDGNYDVRINGELFAWYDSNIWGGEHHAMKAAEMKRDQLRNALGMEGGGDE